MAELDRPYAAFWRRFLAGILDWLPVLIIIGAIENFKRRTHHEPPLLGLALLAYLAYNVVYRVCLSGQSIGKSVLRIRVVRADGEALGRGRCLLRQILLVVLFIFAMLALKAKAIPVFLFLVFCFFWALWDRRGQALHDKLIGTLVAPAEKTEPQPHADPTRTLSGSRSEAASRAGLEGLSIGQYDVLRQIGQGGMGEVYEAVHRQLDRKAALKRMRPEIRANPRDKAAFLKEARTVAELRHPNIIEIYDILEEGEELYLVFEYLSGRTVASWLDEKERLSWNDAARIAHAVCDALDHAHRHKIVHRDLKPSNIMLSLEERFVVKVMDFGIARKAKDTLSRLGTLETSGTLAYMSPEQHLGIAEPCSDVYSMAVTLYEMLTGVVPFQGPDFLAQKERLVYQPVGKLRPDLPKGLDALLLSCLQPRKEQRMPSAAGLWNVLVQLARQGSL